MCLILVVYLRKIPVCIGVNFQQTQETVLLQGIYVTCLETEKKECSISYVHIDDNMYVHCIDIHLISKTRVLIN